MKFWDTSAIVPLLVTQPTSARAQSIHASDPRLAVWWGTSVECASALARLERDSILSSDKARQATSLLANLSTRWLEVLPASEVRELAIRITRIHGLKAADALQLAAALTYAGPSRGQINLVTFDEKLAGAAEREGLSVMKAE